MVPRYSPPMVKRSIASARKQVAAEVRRIKFLHDVGQQALEKFPGNVPATADLEVEGETFDGPKLRKLKVLATHVDAAELKQVQALMQKHQHSIRETALLFIAAISNRQRRNTLLRRALVEKLSARQIQKACSPHLDREAAANVGRMPKIGTNLEAWKRKLGEQAHSLLRVCEAVEAAAETKQQELPEDLARLISRASNAARQLQDSVRG